MDRLYITLTLGISLLKGDIIPFLVIIYFFLIKIFTDVPFTILTTLPSTFVMLEFSFAFVCSC